MHRFRPRLRSAALGLCAAAVALGLFSISPAFGGSPTTLYVDGSSPSCSNSGSGTQGAPFCTITAAVAKVVPGQTVQVAAGTYTEKVTISKSGTATAPIVVTAAPNATVTVKGGTNAFVISGRSWVTVNGFTVPAASDYGITVSSSSSITISNNDVSHAGVQASGLTRAGIRLNNSTGSLIVGNKSHDNSYAGIMVTGGSGNEVRGNETFGNARGFERAAPGIRIYASTANVVDDNVTHDNEDSGIESYSGANDNLIYNNVSYNNGDHGIDDLHTTGQRIVGNTVYRNVTAGINLEGDSTGGTIRNNISVDNGIKSPRTHSDIRVENGSTAGTSVDYNVVYLTTPDTLLIWNSVSYSSLAAYQAASGQMSHGLNADPKWRDIGARDFHLVAGSPAIDYADSGTNGQSALDAENQPRVDDPATPNTGAGPRTYDDAGAFEFQPGPPADAPPAAELTVSPSSGPAPLTVTADASNSSDTDATPIASYTFAFGDGSASVGPQAGASADHSYAAAGTYTVTVTVTDTAGQSTSASSQVSVSGAANLVRNPGFETDLTGWNTSGSDANAVLTRVAGGRSGAWAAQLMNTGSTASTVDLNDSPNWVKTTSPGNYVGGIWARADSPGAVLTVRFREYSGSTLVRTTSAQLSLTTSWQQVSVTHTVAAPGSTLDFNVYVAKAAPGTGFYADDASIASP